MAISIFADTRPVHRSPMARLLLQVLLILMPLVLASCGSKAAKDAPSAPPVRLGVASVKAVDPQRIIVTKDWGPVPANQIAVMLQDGATRADADKIASTLGGAVTGEIAFVNLYQIETPWTTESQLVAGLETARKAGGVAVAMALQEVARRDTPGARCEVTNDPVYGGPNGWSYNAIGLNDAWAILRASGVPLGNVHVGVVDEAVSKDTKELDGPVQVRGIAPDDMYTKRAGKSHGTYVTHVIAANAGNGGVAGVAAYLESKLTVTVVDGMHHVPEAYEGLNRTTGGLIGDLGMMVDIQHQIEAGATIINASWGVAWPGPGAATRNAVWRRFIERVGKEHPQVLFVAAAGNTRDALDGRNDMIAGVALPNVMTVGAIGEDGKASRWQIGGTNYATGEGELTMSAPGSGIVVDVDSASGRPYVEDGTSFAAPMVSASAALIRAVNPKLTASEIKALLVKTASAPVDQRAGPSLRVDRAVLQAINDMRAADRQLKLGDLLGLAAIDVSATQKDATHFTVIARVPKVGDKGTEIRIEVKGAGGAIGGNATQRVNGSGAAEWPLTFDKVGQDVVATVTRLDTSGCARVSVKAANPAPARPVPTKSLRDILAGIAAEPGTEVYTRDCTAQTCGRSITSPARKVTTYSIEVRQNPATGYLNGLLTTAPSWTKVDGANRTTTKATTDRNPHRGMDAAHWTLVSPNSADSMLAVASGTVQLMVRTSWSCQWTQAQVAEGTATCNNPGVTASPGGEMNALIAAAVAANLIVAVP